VFLLGDVAGGEGAWGSFVVFRESQENGLVNFLPTGAGTGGAAA
jgi:hypothetical protein